MRNVWKALSVLAVANLVALAGFIGWLAKSDRLNMDRVRAVRAVVVRTIAEEQAEQEQQARDRAAAEAQAQAEAKASRPPLTAAEKLQARIEATEVDRQRIERLKQEVKDLQQQLAVDRGRLDAERAAFEAEKKQFEEFVAGLNTANADAQFQKTLKILAAQKPDQAVALIMEMLAEAEPSTPDISMAPIANGATPVQPGTAAPEFDPKRMGTVVAYLDAMGDKPRGKIIEALTKTDPKLAADLLERLRKRGEFARVP